MGLILDMLLLVLPQERYYLFFLRLCSFFLFFGLGAIELGLLGFLLGGIGLLRESNLFILWGLLFLIWLLYCDLQGR